MTTCIIFYNAMILSRWSARKEASSDTVGMGLIMQVSPVAWQHINFYGCYEFTKGPEPINVEVIVEALAQHEWLLGEDGAWFFLFDSLSTKLRSAV